MRPGELLPNQPLADVVRKNLQTLNDLRYSEEEKKFAVRLQESFSDKVELDSIGQVFESGGKVGMGSTDVGDISWVVPTAGFTTACFVPGTPGHSWQAVASGGTTIGKKGMQLAAKVLAASAWDLFQDAKLVEAAKRDHRKRLDGVKYQPLLEPGQEPPLNYRDPPKR
jgi:aminobenzoyl-glutamate utilization protein B